MQAYVKKACNYYCVVNNKITYCTLNQNTVHYLMRKFFLVAFLLSTSFYSFSQIKDTAILIIPCKTGELVIDGVSKGKIEAEDVHRVTLGYGDHYIQLKTENVKINSTVKIDNTLSSNILKLGCEVANTNSIRLVDKQISLSGSLLNNDEDNYFALDEGDELKIQSSVLNKKGSANISIIEYDNGMEIYKKSSFTVIQNETVRIPKRSIYKIVLNTDALFGKDARLIVERVPSKNSKPDFKTTVHYVLDTIATEVLNTTNRVYSTSNVDHSNKTSIRINLPATTTYWAYWIGVGQESKDKMKGFISTLSNVGEILGANPLFLFGMKLIPSLPMLNTTSTINYKFMDAINAQLFQNNMNYSYYTFKYGNNISTDYSLVNQVTKDLTLSLWNENTMTGQDVEVRVMAFSVKKRLEMDL
jgi:hypothetical protein